MNVHFRILYISYHIRLETDNGLIMTFLFHLFMAIIHSSCKCHCCYYCGSVAAVYYIVMILFIPLYTQICCSDVIVLTYISYTKQDE